jgi:hypothetical protein
MGWSASEQGELRSLDGCPGANALPGTGTPLRRMPHKQAKTANAGGAPCCTSHYHSRSGLEQARQSCTGSPGSCSGRLGQRRDWRRASTMQLPALCVTAAVRCAASSLPLSLRWQSARPAAELRPRGLGEAARRGGGEAGRRRGGGRCCGTRHQPSPACHAAHRAASSWGQPSCCCSSGLPPPSFWLLLDLLLLLGLAQLLRQVLPELRALLLGRLRELGEVLVQRGAALAGVLNLAVRPDGEPLEPAAAARAARRTRSDVGGAGGWEGRWAEAVVDAWMRPSVRAHLWASVSTRTWLRR